MCKKLQTLSKDEDDLVPIQIPDMFDFFAACMSSKMTFLYFIIKADVSPRGKEHKHPGAFMLIRDADKDPVENAAVQTSKSTTSTHEHKPATSYGCAKSQSSGSEM